MTGEQRMDREAQVPSHARVPPSIPKPRPTRARESRAPFLQRMLREGSWVVITGAISKATLRTLPITTLEPPSRA